MDVGDIVMRKSYGGDVFFRITDILDENIFALAGINYRLKVYTPEVDLMPVRVGRIKEFKRVFKESVEARVAKVLAKRSKEIESRQGQLRPGKVLHIDADAEYLNMCIGYYKQLGISVVGENILEKEQAKEIPLVLKRYMPDILVITGHDSLSDKKNKRNVDNYKSSGYFIDSVKSARLFNPSKNSLVIIAGACQSYYEGLIEAGANVASSPKRILIHALDPLFVAEKIAYTSIDKILSIDEIIENTFTGIDGVGGYQTRGVMREGLSL